MDSAHPPVTARRSRALLHLFLIVAVALWVAFPGLDFRSIENHEHPRFARIAQNILWTGDWVLMRYGGEPYTSKPPLLMWLIAIVSQPFGHVNPWTARLPSALASLLGGLATYGIGARLAERPVGLAAALVLLTSRKWVWYAHSITTDMLLCGGIAVAMYCGVRAVQAQRQSGWWIVCGVAAGLASLAKGPIGLVVPAVVGAGVWAFAAPARPRIRPSTGWAVVGFLVVFAPWVVMLANRIGWTGMGEIVDRELLNRATSPTGQAKSVWYYAQKLPGELVPWTVLWPALVLLVRPAQVRPEWRNAARLGWVWALVPIALFTLSRGKASRFILCVYPGWALLTGLAVQQVLDRWDDARPWDRRLVYWPITVGAVLALVAPLLLFLPLPGVPQLPLLRVAGLSGILLAFMGGYLLIAHRHADRLRVAVGIVICASLFSYVWHLRLLGANDDAESPYKMMAREAHVAAAGRPIVTYGLIDHRVNYHFRDAPVESAEAVHALFATGSPLACAFQQQHWEELQDELSPWIGETQALVWGEKPVVLALSKVAPQSADILPRTATEPPSRPSLRSVVRPDAIP